MRCGLLLAGGDGRSLRWLWRCGLRRRLCSGGLAGGAARFAAGFLFHVAIILFPQLDSALVFGVLHEDTKELAGEADRHAVEDGLKVSLVGRELAEDFHLLHVEGVGIDRIDGFADAVGQDELGSGHVAILCLNEESIGEDGKALLAEGVTKGLPKRGDAPAVSSERRWHGGLAQTPSKPDRSTSRTSASTQLPEPTKVLR